MISQFLGLASGFVVAKLLGPTHFGVWNAVSLALVYGAYCDLGVLPAMGRDLPFYRGQGDLHKAKEIESTTLSTTLISAALVALVLLGMSFWGGYSPLMALGLRGMALVIVLQRLYVYYQTVLRCYNEFGLLSKLRVIFAMLSTVLVILMVIWFGFVGRVAAAILAQLLILIYVLFLRKIYIFPRLNLQVAWQLAKVGLPIILSVVIIGLLTTIDRLMVITYLGATELGYFGIALLVTSIVFLIPGAANQVLYPRLTHRYGEAGKDIRALKNLVLTPTILLAYLAPALIGLIYLTLPTLIELFLPKYAPGVFPSRIVLLGMFFFSIIGVTNYFLVTIGELKQYVLLGFLALALNITLNFLLLRIGMGIEGIALGGTLITYFCYATAIIGYALSHYTRRIGDWVKFFAKLFIPFVYMLLLLTGLERFVNFPNSHWPFQVFFTLGIRLFLFGVGCVPLVYAASREMKIEFKLTTLQHWSRQLVKLMKL